MKYNSNIGFTLAEVLITLGIIGVVAAMTIPNLLANVSAGQYRSGLKKVAANLSQAGLVAQEQYDFNYASAELCSAMKQEDSYYYNPEQYQNRCALIGGTQKGATYLGYGATYGAPTYIKEKWKTKNVTVPYGPGSSHLYLLADGSIVGFPQYTPNAGRGSCTIEMGETLEEKLKDSDWKSSCVGFVDVNGVSKPNEETRCQDGRSNSAQYNLDNPCVVKSRDIKDIYPIAFHDTTAEPATVAGRYVLNSSK